MVIDAGALYDPLAAYLQAAGLPVFRTADRAMGVLAQYVGARPGR